MQIVDANMILRYLLNDHQEFSAKAKEIIDGNTVEVPIEVLCEVVFVLLRVYKLERKEIVTHFEQLTNFVYRIIYFIYKSLKYAQKILKNVSFFDILIKIIIYI